VWDYYCAHVDWVHIIAWIDAQYSSDPPASTSAPRWPLTEPISAQMIASLHSCPARLADHLLDRLARSVFSAGRISVNTTEAQSFHLSAPYSSIRTPQNMNSSLREIIFTVLFIQFYLGLIACTLFLLLACILCCNPAIGCNAE